MQRILLRSAAACGVLIVLAAALYFYVLRTGMPFSFYSDIGVDIITTARMTASAHSPADLLSFVAWQPWYNYPEFLYSPMLAYALSLPVNWIFRDAAETVKFIQILQFGAAFFGAAAVYRLLFRNSAWQWWAGALYAAVPMVALQIRGNMSIGWVVALVPVGYAVGVACVRKWGVRALPIAGVAASVAAFCFDTEYGVLVSAPLYLLVALHADCWRTWSGRLWFLAGLFAFALTPAYVILPTVFDSRLFGWSSTASHEFSGGLVLAKFSQDWVSLSALVLKEDLLSLRPELNASGSLWLAMTGGLVICLALVTFFATSYRRVWRRWIATIVVCVILALLSMGPAVPLFGTLVWFIFSKAPILSALRTPDRFYTLPALLLILGAVRVFEIGALRRKWLAGISSALVLLCAVSFAAFDAREHVLSLQRAQTAMPALGPVNEEAARLGGRTMSLAFVKDGSVFDTPLYGEPLGTLSYGWDLVGRFGAIDSGVGLLRRAGVHSIITSPTWLYEAPPLPANLAVNVRDSGFARQTLHTRDGVDVFSVDSPRPPLFATRVVCYSGAPDGLDVAAGLKMFSDSSFVVGNRSDCNTTIGGDLDPIKSAINRSNLAFWPGTSMFKDQTLGPSPYAFEVGRLFLSSRWYQNALYASASPFATNSEEMTSYPLIFTVKKPARYAAYIHASGPGWLFVRDTGGHWRSAALSGTRALEWLNVPLGDLQPGRYDIALDLRRPPLPAQSSIIDAVAVAPERLAPTAGTPLRVESAQRFVPVEPRANPMIPVFPLMQRTAAFTAGEQGVQLAPGARLNLHDRTIVMRGRQSEATFRWTGPPGRYALMGAAWLSGVGAELELRAAGSARSVQYDIGTAPDPTSVFLTATLHPGDPIVVSISSPSRHGQSILAMVHATKIETRLAPVAFGRRTETYVIDASAPLSAFAAAPRNDFEISRNSISAYPGAVATFSLRPLSVGGGFVSARVRVEQPSPGDVALQCGTHRKIAPILADETTVIVPRTGHSACTAQIHWRSYNLRVTSLLVSATGTRLYGRRDTIATQRGPMHFETIVGGGLRTFEGTVDGARVPESGVVNLSAGSHELLVDAPDNFTGVLMHTAALRVLSPLPQPRVLAASNTKWSIGPMGPHTVEVSMLNDGFWAAHASGRTITGYDCDLINTCFDLPGGPAVITHALPEPIGLGLAVTCIVIVLSLLALRRTRRPLPHLNYNDQNLQLQRINL